MNKKPTKPSWSGIKPKIAKMDKDGLIGLVKDLFDASSDNKAFLLARFPPDDTPGSGLEDYKRRIWEQFYPKRGFGSPSPKICRKVISDYRKASGDLQGLIDLMLLYVEAGTRFTNDYGDIDAGYYNSLLSVLDEALKALSTPKGIEIYPEFQDRLLDLADDAKDIGWGYGDEVIDLVTTFDAEYEDLEKS